jgi:predicted extracellular nuclease
MKKLYSVLFLFLPLFIYSQTTDLLISKYGEGSSNNKFLEIYNGTGADIDLSNYSLSNCNNGCDVVDVFDYPNTLTFPTGTIISHGDVYVITHPSADAEIASASDQTHLYLSNGDDAYALTFVDPTSGGLTIIDILGDMEEADVGDGWEVAGVSEATKNHTLTRKSSVCSPNSTPLGSFGTDAEDSEWIVTDQNSGWDTLGSYSSDCVEDISLTITSLQDGYSYRAGTSVATINFSVSNFSVGASGEMELMGMFTGFLLLQMELLLLMVVSKWHMTLIL